MVEKDLLGNGAPISSMLNKGKLLEHFSIPISFLKLPLIENIGMKPNQNYPYRLQGQIHSQKYLKIIEEIVIEHEQNNWKEKLSENLTENAILPELMKLSHSQVLDFLIHIAYANSQIDWNSISILEDYLQRELDHVSRWHLPDLDFTTDIKSFYSRLIELKLDRETFQMLDEINHILDTNELADQKERIIDPKILTQIKTNDLLNLGDFYGLLANLTVLQNSGLIQYQKFPQLQESLHKEWMDIRTQGNISDFDQIILFNLHSITLILKDRPDELKQCQRLLNSTITDVNALPPSKQKSYLWLVDSIKVLVVNEVTKYKMELVTEDLLLRSIGDRFFNPENTDLRTWSVSIESSDLPIWIIILIIRGYLSVEQILHRYYTELPQTDNDNLITINNFLMSLLTTFDNNYIIGDSKHSVKLPFHLEYYLTESWVKTSLNQLKIIPKKKPKDKVLSIDRITGTVFSDYFDIYRLCSDILLDNYPFEEYLKLIRKNEEEIDYHLIGNENFANLFVDKFARIFNYAQQQQINKGTYPKEKYDLIMFFLQSWFPYLLQIDKMIQDTIIIFLSFYNVIVNMLEEYYSKKGRLKNAKLYDLNTKLLELNLFFEYGYPELANINKMLSKKYIFDNFRKMLKQFNLSEEITTIDSRYWAIDTTYDVSTFKLNQSIPKMKPEKLHEDKIMEYLELQSTLQKFLDELQNSDLNKIKEIIINNPFKSRNPPLSLLDNMNPSTPVKYPIIRPINAFAAAIRFFDLDLEFSTSNIIESSKDN